MRRLNSMLVVTIREGEDQKSAVQCSVERAVEKCQRSIEERSVAVIVLNKASAFWKKYKHENAVTR